MFEKILVELHVDMFYDAVPNINMIKCVYLLDICRWQPTICAALQSQKAVSAYL